MSKSFLSKYFDYRLSKLKTMRSTKTAKQFESLKIKCFENIALLRNSSNILVQVTRLTEFQIFNSQLNTSHVDYDKRKAKHQI